MEGDVFFNGQGKPIGYDYQRTGIAGATIRPEQRQSPQILSRKDSERVQQAVKAIKQGEKKSK
jgi:hypothetical protein